MHLCLRMGWHVRLHRLRGLGSLSPWLTRALFSVKNLIVFSLKIDLSPLPSPFKILPLSTHNAATAAKSRQSCPTLCDHTDGSPPGSAVPGILQARTLEWAAISFSSAWKWRVKVKSLSCVWLFATPWTVTYQAPPSMGFSRQEYWSGVPLPSPLPTIALIKCSPVWRELPFKQILIYLFGCAGTSVFIAACGLLDICLEFPEQRSNLGPLHWEHRFSATEPLGKSW